MKLRLSDILLFGALVLCASTLRAQAVPIMGKIVVGAGKSYLIDTPVNIERLMVASPGVAEAVVVSPRTAVINGLGPGMTSLVVWLSDGTRQQYDLNVTFSAQRFDSAQEQLAREFGSEVRIESDGSSVYLTGTVKDIIASIRAASIAETAGKVINLLNVQVPPQETQILVKVRFANVDRSRSRDLALNFAGIVNGYPATVTTGGTPAPRVQSVANGTATFSLSDTLNLFLFDPKRNLNATIKALEGKNVLQLLAEPNLLTMNGKEASFTSGGQFPYPTIQGGGGGVGQITVAFREFGIRLRVLPVITPQGTIRMHIAPEVSSLDYANSLTTAGATVPGVSTRRVETDVELQSGQTFAIAGLLDQRATESLSRIPGLADIPILGKLFTSKTISRSNSELLILVTPELVTPVQADQPIPDLERPLDFLEGKGIMNTPPRTPGVEQTGVPASAPRRTELPIQELQAMAAQDAARESNLRAASADNIITGGSNSGQVPSITDGMGPAPAPSAAPAAPAGGTGK